MTLAPIPAAAPRRRAFVRLTGAASLAIALTLSGESVTPSFWMAGALMAVGVWLHLTEQHGHDHVHEPMRHTHPHTHDEHHQHRHDFAWESGKSHSHPHEHVLLVHRHPHFPDIHHRHPHDP